MKKELVYSQIINLVVGLSFGIISSFFTTNLNSFMIGIFGTVFSYLIQIQQLVVRSETTQKRLLETITRLNPSNPISEVILKYGLKQMHLGYNKGFKVGAEDFWELWIDCLYRTKSTWKGLSLTDSWECAISSQGRDFEKFKILKECSIKRVFI